MQYPSSGGLRKQMAHMRLSVQSANQRAVADDHRQRGIDFASDGHREVITAAGHQRYLNATARRLGDGDTVRLRQFPAAIQQRTVDIEGDQTHSHTVYCSSEILHVLGLIASRDAKE